MAKGPFPIPPASKPVGQQRAAMVAQHEEMRKQAEQLRRLLWLAIKVSDGRIEIPIADYDAVMKRNETGGKHVKVYGDEREKKVCLVYADEKGEIHEDSKAKLIVLTDG